MSDSHDPYPKFGFETKEARVALGTELADLNRSPEWRPGMSGYQYEDVRSAYHKRRDG